MSNNGDRDEENSDDRQIEDRRKKGEKNNAMRCLCTTERAIKVRVRVKVGVRVSVRVGVRVGVRVTVGVKVGVRVIVGIKVEEK